MRVMTSNRPKARADLARRGLVAVLATIVGLLLAACGDEGPATNAGVRIPVEWADARKVRSHETHVGKRKIECSKCHELDQGVLGPVPQERCAECHQGEAEIVHGAENARKLHGPDRGRELPGLPRLQSEAPAARPEGGPGGLGLSALPQRAPRRRRSGGGRAPLPGVPDLSSAPRKAARRTDELPDLPQRCERHPRHRRQVAGAGMHHLSRLAARAGQAPPTSAAPAATPSRNPSCRRPRSSPKGTRECTGCHRPHDFRPENVVSCRSCHEDRPVLGGGRIAAHAQCNSCHRPHDVKADPSGGRVSLVTARARRTTLGQRARRRA